MAVDFSRLTNTDLSTTPFQYVVFGKNGGLLEVELNEAQLLSYERQRSIIKLIGNVCSDQSMFSYEESTSTLTISSGILALNGYLINLSESVSISDVTEGSKVYATISLETLDKESVVNKFGLSSEDSIENTIEDNRVGIETTRRQSIKLVINTTESANSVLLGGITNNVFVSNLTCGNISELLKEQQESLNQINRNLVNLQDDVKSQFDNADGSNFTIDNSVNGKITEMKLYGKSEQKQYSGKNLLNPTLQTTTMNGVTCTNNGDGTYTLNGTATNEVIIQFFTTLKAGTYKFIGTPPNIESYYCRYWLENGISGDDNGKGFVRTLTKTTTFSYNLYVKKEYTVNNVIFKLMVTTDLEATYDDFESYCGGIPSPNPDYPQEIKSVVNPSVKVCGKNLFNIPSVNKDHIILDNGGLFKNTSWDSTDFIECNDDVYTLSEKNKGNYFQYRFAFYDFNKKYLSTTNAEYNGIYKIKITKPKDARYLRICYSKKVNGNDVNREEIQLEIGEIATSYEPYKPIQKATLPYTLNAIPVTDGGNVTIDGQQYIADYVDFEKKQLVRMVGEVNLGLITWYYTGSNGLYKAYITNHKLDFDGDLCNKLQVLNRSSYFTRDDGSEIQTINNENGTPIVHIKNKNVSNADELKSLLAGTILFYPLATQTTIDLTDEEVQAFKALSTYNPTTNVFVTSEQLDGYTEFSYPTTDVSGMASENAFAIDELNNDLSKLQDNVDSSDIQYSSYIKNANGDITQSAIASSPKINEVVSQINNNIGVLLQGHNEQNSNLSELSTDVANIFGHGIDSDYTEIIGDDLNNMITGGSYMNRKNGIANLPDGFTRNEFQLIVLVASNSSYVIQYLIPWQDAKIYRRNRTYINGFSWSEWTCLQEKVDSIKNDLVPKKIELQNVDTRVTIQDNGSFIINGFAFVNLLVTVNKTIPKLNTFVRLPRPKGDDVSVYCENSVILTIYSQNGQYNLPGDCGSYKDVVSGTELRLLVNYEVA